MSRFNNVKHRFATRFRDRPLAALVAGLAVALAGAALATAAVHAPPAAGVLEVRVDGDRALTRVIIEVDEATMLADPTFPAGNRMVLTFPKTGAEGVRRAGAGGGLVKGWAVDRADGQTRLQLDLEDQVTVAKRFLLPPGEGADHWRYVIDLKAAVPSRAVPTVVTAERRATDLHARRVVVIDAGHGGMDSGAQGGGVLEKDVTLAAATELKARLERSGLYRVVLTRNADFNVPLEARVQIARRADADLFISLHADAGPDANLRGASAYTLSENGADRVAKVLGKDGLTVQTAGGGGKAVEKIVLDLTQRSTKTRSAAFADLLLENVGRETPLLGRSHRDGGFVVLLAPEVPAVLLEMGFITSPQDERFLTRSSDRQRLVEAVGDAIDAFFQKYDRLTLG